MKAQLFPPRLLVVVMVVSLLSLLASVPFVAAVAAEGGEEERNFLVEHEPEDVSWKGSTLVRQQGQPLGLGLGWLTACVSNVYAVARCEDAGKSFNFCVNDQGRRAEFGDCRTKHAPGSRTRRLVVALKGTELCNKTPFYDTVKLILLGSVSDFALKHTTSSMAEGGEEGGGGQRSWSSCYVPVSPFRSFNATVQLQSKGQTRCVISAERNFSSLRALFVLVGFLLIVSSPMLSKSLTFRVGLGAIFAVVIGVGWGVYYCTKRPKWTGLSSVLVAIAALNQSWWRSFLSENNLSKLLIVYCIASACGGAAISYYFDTALSSGKAVSIISTGFQAVGCLFIYFNSQSVAVSAVLISGAFAVHVLKIDIVVRTLELMTSNRKQQVIGGSGRSRSQAASQSIKREKKSPSRRDVVDVDAINGPPTPTRTSPRRKKSRPFSPTLDKTEAKKRSPANNFGLASSPRTPTTQGIANANANTNPNPSSPPWVTEGMLMNEETHRLIHVGKGTYKKLVKDGWVVNKEVGVISPPSKKRQ